MDVTIQICEVHVVYYNGKRGCIRVRCTDEPEDEIVRYVRQNVRNVRNALAVVGSKTKELTPDVTPDTVA